MVRSEVKLPAFKCLRCGHVWHPRKPKTPVCCAKCKSPYWNERRAEEEAKKS